MNWLEAALAALALAIAAGLVLLTSSARPGPPRETGPCEKLTQRYAGHPSTAADPTR